MSFFDKLKQGLAKTRENLSNGLDTVFGDYSQVDDEFFENLEETLIMSDVGVAATDKILSELREKIYEKHIHDPEGVRRLFVETVSEQMSPDEHAYDFEKERSVVLVIGVNGVGKTTSIGKLASNFKADGKKVILAAADTFRAAAIEQLEEWANRVGVDIISNKEGTDPASVIYDAVAAMKSRNGDILICDTAGRLHNKKNLMDELSKIGRIIDRELPGVRKEVLLVLDATTGQNALAQAREFISACDASGIILTKMDGTAKGGIVIAISSELNIPVKYIGVGEHMDDLQKFDPESFLKAIFE